MNSSQHIKISRIGLIITIVAGLAVGALNGFKVREKIRGLQSSLHEQTTARQNAETTLAGTSRELETVVAAFTRTKTTLQTVTEEKDSALANAAGQRQRAEKLAKDLAIALQELDQDRTELARYRAAGMAPEQIIRASALAKTLQQERDVLKAQNDILHKQVRELAIRGEEPCVIKLPAGLDGKVLVFDPRWKFAVLDVGENQGVLPNGELLVNRAGKLVAKVVVARVEKQRCVVTLVPGWGLGEIVEGDRVVPAHPES